MTWHFTDFHAAKKRPVDNSELCLHVEPRENGKWCLRFAGSPVEDRIGNYNTAEEAEKTAKANCSNVKVIMPPIARSGPQAYLPSASPDEALIATIKSA